MKNVAIIMAGGSGTRLWPLSNRTTPKQFLKLTDSDKTMIQLSRERIQDFISTEDIYILITKGFEELVYTQLPDIPKENVIIQPINKNTAPGLALASEIIKRKYDDANVVVLASDHNIKNTKLLVDCFKNGIASLTDDNIVTIGIVPNRIETGYGYIKLGNKNNDNIYEVERFVEKPDFKTAKEYFESGEYLWNSGMFIWKNSTILKYIEEYMSDTYTSVKNIVNSLNDKNYNQIILEEYEKMESISIDYAIMEKVNKILVVPGNFGWDDVGSWLALERLSNLDENKNFMKGKIISLNTQNSIIRNESASHLITTVGVDNLVIVNTDKSTLIINKNSISDISKLQSELQNKDLEEYL